VKNSRGFTLIELLIVLGIVAILVAIAIPAYLGKREKSRAVAIEADARGVVSEIQSILDSFVAGEPYIVLNILGVETCVQEANAASFANKTCQAVYNKPSSDVYSNINDVLQDIIDHHAGKNELSPFNSSNNLFVLGNNGIPGTVLLFPTDNRTIRIHAYAQNPGTPIFDTNVTVR